MLRQTSRSSRCYSNRTPRASHCCKSAMTDTASKARCEGSAGGDASDVILSLVRLDASHDLEPASAAISRGTSIHLFGYLNGSIDGCAMARFCTGESAPQKRKDRAWRPSDGVPQPCRRRTSANERLVALDPTGRQGDHPLMASARQVFGMPAGAPAASRASPRHHGQHETGSMSTSIPLWLHDQARIVPSRAIPLMPLGSVHGLRPQSL